jgi:hypothetical protein
MNVICILMADVPEVVSALSPLSVSASATNGDTHQTMQCVIISMWFIMLCNIILLPSSVLVLDLVSDIKL